MGLSFLIDDGNSVAAYCLGGGAAAAGWGNHRTGFLFILECVSGSLASLGPLIMTHDNMSTCCVLCSTQHQALKTTV